MKEIRLMCRTGEEDEIRVEGTKRGNLHVSIGDPGHELGGRSVYLDLNGAVELGRAVAAFLRANAPAPSAEEKTPEEEAAEGESTFDASRPYGERYVGRCNAKDCEDDGWTCTRLPNHSGDHIPGPFTEHRWPR